MQGDTAKAEAAYQDFLTVWKGAFGTSIKDGETGWGWKASRKRSAGLRSRVSRQPLVPGNLVIIRLTSEVCLWIGNRSTEGFSLAELHTGAGVSAAGNYD